MNISIWDSINAKSACYMLQKPIQSMCMSHIILDDEVFEFPSLSPLHIKQARFVCCNDDTTLLLTHDGLVYGWGLNRSELLGSKLSNISKPLQLSKLMNIVHIGISKTHAAAIDEAGSLFTWGDPQHGKLGYNSAGKTTAPESVLSSRAFRSIQVVCGNKFTCVRSDGCFIHIYGELGQEHATSIKMSQSRSPKGTRSYSHPELDKYSVIELTAGDCFIAMLVESGDAFIMDGCMDLVKLPAHCDSKVNEIVALKNSVWGVSSDFLLHWKLPEKKLVRTGCALAGWTGKVYESSRNLKIFQYGTGFAIASEICDVLSEELHEISPYKRSDYARQLFVNALESPSLSFKIENRVPLNSFEDLQRLFPTGDSQKTMDKIMECRIQHYKREVFAKAFGKIIHPSASFAMAKMKEFAWLNMVYKKTITLSKFFNGLSSAIKRVNSSYKQVFFQIVKSLRKVQIIIENPESVKKIEKTVKNFELVHCECLNIGFSSLKNDRGYLMNAVLSKVYKRVYFSKMMKQSVFFLNLMKICKLIEVYHTKRFFRCIVGMSFNKITSQLKIQNFVKIIKSKVKSSLNSAFQHIKGSIMSSVLLNFRKKYVLEKFAKNVQRQHSIVQVANLRSSFNSLKLATKRLQSFSLFLKSLSHSLFRAKKFCFLSILRFDSTQSSTPLNPLKSLLKSLSKSILSDIFLASQKVLLQKITNFAIALHKINSRSDFKHKVFSFYRLKPRNSRAQSVTNGDELMPTVDSSSETSKPSPFDAIFLDKDFLKQARSVYSPDAIRRKHQCWVSTSSPKASKSSFELTRFYKGEKMSYEKYLIMKKIEEINESPDVTLSSPPSTPHKPKIPNERPPWKPVSVYNAKKTVHKKSESAIKRGFDYNQQLRRKLMKQRSSNDLGTTQQTCITHEKVLIAKGPSQVNVPRSPKSSAVEEVKLMNSKVVNIGFASMLLGKLYSKLQYCQVKSVFYAIKKMEYSPWKQPAPTPIDSPKFAPHAATLSIIKASWQMGVILMASEKTKEIMRKQAGRVLFDRIGQRAL